MNRHRDAASNAREDNHLRDLRAYLLITRLGLGLTLACIIAAVVVRIRGPTGQHTGGTGAPSWSAELVAGAILLACVTLWLWLGQYLSKIIKRHL